MAFLFTLGYEKRSIDEFIGLLLDYRVDVLIDVRDVPWSHKPAFAKKALAAAVAAKGIEYVHADFAGNPKALRASAETNAEALALYARRLDQHPEVLARFTELLEPLLTAEKRVALVCYERDPAACHRGILAERWRAATGGQVTHLGTG